ncbi:hypothetical protein Tco_1579609, partial [Tanacetum coccineum]
VLVPLSDDPYVAVRQARLVDIESKLEEAPSEAKELQSLGSIVPLIGEEFEDVEPLGTRTDSSHSSASSYSNTPLSHDHPLTNVSPTPTPIRASFHHRMARMTLSVIGDELGNEDIEEDESLDADDEGERLNDEDRGLDDEGHGLDDEGCGLEGEGLGLEEEEAAPEGQQQAIPVVDTATSEPLGLGYRADRHRALDSIEEIVPSTYEVGQSSRSMPEQQGEDRVSAFRQPTLTTWVDPEDDKVYTDILVYPPLGPVQTPLSPEWSSGSFPFSPSSSVVPSPIASPVATPTATISIDEDQFLEVGA